MQAELDQRLDVGRNRAREAPDLGVESCVADELDRARVVRGHAREAGLDPVDAEPVEQARDLELLLRVERHADGLLAVAERRVVEPDVPAWPVAERVGVQIAEVELVRRDAHVRTIPSGKRHSFSGAPSVISQLSSTRRPPPPSQ